ncbi:hypothetical protein B0T14DRAFT_56955 [Immersiella caudata]|uniref:Uncharacterized protein n=1 Tax=Immersiella caudata TaxID=314043 RepID=A0AA39XH22_9PEZI|nr:hypothetical protein B0T14DRAFT_56955 [Immersiella caudata]
MQSWDPSGPLSDPQSPPPRTARQPASRTWILANRCCKFRFGSEISSRLQPARSLVCTKHTTQGGRHTTLLSARSAVQPASSCLSGSWRGFSLLPPSPAEQSVLRGC